MSDVLRVVAKSTTVAISAQGRTAKVKVYFTGVKLIRAGSQGPPGISGTGAYVFNEEPTGTTNGSNAVFTLAFVPVSGKLLLSKNGLVQKPGTSNDYVLSGSTITFTAGAVPQIGDSLEATYQRS